MNRTMDRGNLSMPCLQRKQHNTNFLTRRLRGLLEVVMAILLWGILVGSAADIYMDDLQRSQITEVFSHSNRLREEMMEAYSVDGDWPTNMDNMIQSIVLQKTIKQILYEKGGFTFVLDVQNRRYRLSFRAAVSTYSPRAPVSWLCGYEAIPEGYHSVAQNHTDIPPLLLPAACRGVS